MYELQLADFFLEHIHIVFQNENSNKHHSYKDKYSIKDRRSNILRTSKFQEGRQNESINNREHTKHDKTDRQWYLGKLHGKQESNHNNEPQPFIAYFFSSHIICCESSEC